MPGTKVGRRSWGQPKVRAETGKRPGMGWDEMVRAGTTTVAQLPFAQVPPTRSHPTSTGPGAGGPWLGQPRALLPRGVKGLSVLGIPDT